MEAVGDDVALASLRALGHGAGSELPIEDAVWLVGRRRRGKCVWWRVCYTRDEALEAAAPSGRARRGGTRV